MPGPTIRAVEVYGKFHKCKRNINLHKMDTGKQRWIAQIRLSIVSAQSAVHKFQQGKGPDQKLLKIYKILGDHHKVLQELITVKYSSI